MKKPVTYNAEWCSCRPGAATHNLCHDPHDTDAPHPRGEAGDRHHAGLRALHTVGMAVNIISALRATSGRYGTPHVGPITFRKPELHHHQCCKHDVATGARPIGTWEVPVIVPARCPTGRRLCVLDVCRWTAGPPATMEQSRLWNPRTLKPFKCIACTRNV